MVASLAPIRPKVLRHSGILEEAAMLPGSGRLEAHESKAEYWERRANDINLSMPESIEYYQYKLEKAIAEHEGLKNGTIPRGHSFSLTYAKKAVNELEKNLQIAKRLWA